MQPFLGSNSAPTLRPLVVRWRVRVNGGFAAIHATFCTADDGMAVRVRRAVAGYVIASEGREVATAEAGSTVAYGVIRCSPG